MSFAKRFSCYIRGCTEDFVWPFVSRKKYEKLEERFSDSTDRHCEKYKKLEVEHTRQIEDNVRLSTMYQKKIENIEKENNEKWQPLLQQLIKISARRTPDYSYILSTAFDSSLVDCVASYNSNYYWDYFCDQVSYELKRQLATLNFSGLHKMAIESEEKKYRLASYERSFPGARLDPGVALNRFEG